MLVSLRLLRVHYKLTLVDRHSVMTPREGDMRMVLLRGAIALVVCVAVSGASRVAVAQFVGGAGGCPPRPVCGVASGGTIGIGGSFGNAGFAAGYSMQLSRAAWSGGWSGGWCGRPAFAPICPPSWCGPSFPACGPWGGWSFGWPGCGIGGWYGGSRFLGSQTVAIGGLGGTFFSGAAVPCVSPWWWGGYPANWLPGCAVTPFGVICSPYATLLPAGFGPQFGPAGVRPFLGSAARPRIGTPPGAAVAVASRPRPPLPGMPRGADRRAATESGRRRAADLVASGDRQVRAAAGDATALRVALATYRRAAAAERDCPDTFIRQAIVHAALGDRAAGDEALAKAVALDARLGAAAEAGAGDTGDPVFSARPGSGRSVLAARGDALIAVMAEDDEGRRDAEGLAWLGQRWSARWVDGLGGLAAAVR